jgi:YHS domain-containing protein
MGRIAGSLDNGRVSFGARDVGGSDRLVSDPVCGTRLRTSDAAAASEHGGRRYFFCSHTCQRAFDRRPAGYVASPDVPDGWDGPTIEDTGHSAD